jgi:hypothetical protein
MLVQGSAVPDTHEGSAEYVDAARIHLRAAAGRIAGPLLSVTCVEVRVRLMVRYVAPQKGEPQSWSPSNERLLRQVGFPIARPPHNGIFAKIRKDFPVIATIAGSKYTF